MDSKKKAINSISWVTLSSILQTFLQFLQISILARLLSPADFGIVAISNTAIIFFSLFANLGFSNSIISRQENNNKVLSSIYFLSIALGAIIFLSVFFSSSLVVNFYHEPRLSKVIKIASCIFLVDYFGSIYAALLQKELKFKSIAIIEIICTLIGVSITIVLAYKGYKELSLVIGGLVADICRTLLRIFLGRKLFSPSLNFNFSKVKEHLKFGIFNFGDGIIGFVQANWDNIIIGRLLGVQVLGYYTLAYQLAIFPINKINPIILQVAFPVIAKLKDNASELRNLYLKILDIISYFNFPLLAGLFITVESIVPLIYGPGWEATFPLIKIFVFVSLLSCLNHPLFILAYTKGKPNLLFYLNLITLVAKIPLVYFLGKYWHITGIAVAFLLITLFNVVLNFFIVHSLIGTFIKRFFINFYKPACFCLVMILGIFLYKHFVGYVGLINAAIEIVLGGIIYLMLTLVFKFSIAEIKQIKKFN